MTAAAETLEAEFVETTPAPLAVAPQPPAEVSLFTSASPRQQVALATEIATVLADIIDKRKLYTEIQGKKHVRVEGWQTCGMLVGVSAKIVGDVQRVENPDGYRARAVVVRVSNGIEIGAGEGLCTRKESRWKSADDYAVASMAQTRALSRSLRGVLGWIVTLAGYEATPAEEVPPGGFNDAPRREPEQPRADRPQRVQLQVIMDLAEQAGIAPGHITPWLEEHVPAPGLSTRKPKMLTPEESIEAKRQLDALIAQQADGLVDEESAPASPPARAPRKPSDKQRGMLFGLHSKLKHNDGDRHLIYQRVVGKASYGDLTADDVARLIDHLESLT